MIKLQDFAKEKGVTDRTIYRHLKNHEKELKKHFSRKGKQGTWLDEYACDFISNLLNTNSIGSPTATKIMEELDKLKSDKITLLEEIKQRDEIIIGLQNQNKQLEMKNQKLLQESSQKKGLFAWLFERRKTNDL